MSCTRVPLHWRRLFAIAVYTYARGGELGALQWEDVDLDRGTVHIHRAVDRLRGGTKATKTDVARRFPIEPGKLAESERKHASNYRKGFQKKHGFELIGPVPPRRAYRRTNEITVDDLNAAAE